MTTNKFYKITLTVKVIESNKRKCHIFFLHDFKYLSYLQNNDIGNFYLTLLWTNFAFV
jgi:hypothetical protein